MAMSALSDHCRWPQAVGATNLHIFQRHDDVAGVIAGPDGSEGRLDLHLRSQITACWRQRQLKARF